MLKKGDLIRFLPVGRLATLLRDEYSARFIDAEDEEMIAHGMGEYAGTYGTAIDVCFVDTMQPAFKLKVTRYNVEVLSSGS